VLHGSDAHTLRLGAGHIENTALPGESGNVAIAGHRDSFFRPLQDVHVGDDIMLDTPEERAHYRVTFTRVVNSYDVGVIAPTHDASLTLVTCYPFWFIGQAPDRFVVRASRVESPVAGDAEFSASSRNTAKSTTDGAPRFKAAPESRNEPRPTAGSGIQDEHDDVRLVRDAVERFRSTYNARLSRHQEPGSLRALSLGSCEVSIDQQNATALCNATSENARGEPWTFRLVRAGDQWAISSITTN